MGLGALLGGGAGLLLGGPGGAAAGASLGGAAESAFGGDSGGSGSFWKDASNVVSNLLGSSAPLARAAVDYEAQNRQYELQKQINADNLAFQKETLDYQKGTQKETWNREDNAVQRRLADLKAAGLSPALAAGSAASTSAPMQVITPQRGENKVPAFNVGQVLESIAMMNQFAKSKAETEYIKAQTEASRAQTESTILSNMYANASYSDRLADLQLEMGEKGARTNLAWANQQLLAEDLKWYKATGKYPRMQDSSNWGRALDTIKFLQSDTAKKAWNAVKEEGGKIIDKGSKKWEEINKNMGGRPGY